MFMIVIHILLAQCCVKLYKKYVISKD